MNLKIPDTSLQKKNKSFRKRYVRVIKATNWKANVLTFAMMVSRMLKVVYPDEVLHAFKVVRKYDMFKKDAGEY